MYIGTILLLSLASALAKEADEVRSRFVTTVGPNFCVIGLFSHLFHCFTGRFSTFGARHLVEILSVFLS
jgi:hypothetical protein